MARIRTVKPEFFQDEDLQDLERDFPDLHPMLVFLGLVCQCDRQGVFEWKPRTLSLHILPFLWRGSTGEAPEKHMEQSLELLRFTGHVSRLLHEGRTYGYLPTFTKHQRINGKEAQAPPKHPPVADMEQDTSPWKHPGSTGEAPGHNPGALEGKGREGKGKEEDQVRVCSQRARTVRTRFQIPTLEEVRAYIQAQGYPVDPERWHAYYSANGWKVGKNPMKDWQAAVRTWARSDGTRPQKGRRDDGVLSAREIAEMAATWEGGEA